MYFSQAYRIIFELDRSNTFQLTPSASAISFTKACAITDASSRRDCFNIGYFTDNREVHHGNMMPSVAAGFKRALEFRAAS